jgi:hypothetical protein
LLRAGLPDADDAVPVYQNPGLSQLTSVSLAATERTIGRL